jgi:propionate CoA-transferase
MSRQVQIRTAEEIAASIPNGATLVSTGFSLIGVAEEIYQAIEHRFLETDQPRDLTFVHSAGQSDRIRGMEHFAHAGLLKRIVGSHWGLAPKLEALISSNQVEAFCFPMGQIISLYKAMASGKPGILSRIGLNTFVDPLYDGGRINERAKESEFNLVERLEIRDENVLFYRSFPLHVYIGRGTTADEAGNITMEDECAKLEVMSAVQAVKAQGGRVIFQVKNIAQEHTLPAQEIVVPGFLVDEIVVCEKPEIHHRMTSSIYMNPVLTGEIHEPVLPSPPSPLSIKKIIGRRAVLELPQHAVVNLGVGIPGDAVGSIIEEEQLHREVTLSVEVGTIGGITLGGGDFGVTKNAEAIIEKAYQFDYYNGCGVDITFMGAAEMDVAGHVNVSKFKPRTPGCGGFIDITQNAKAVVFCSTFTSGGLTVDIIDGKLEIVNEGRFKKFVRQVQQITFNGTYAAERCQPVWYVTERAVFRLVEGGIELVEIAPGIDLERDILAQMEFEPKISKELGVMDTRIFCPESMKIKLKPMKGVYS